MNSQPPPYELSQGCGHPVTAQPMPGHRPPPMNNGGKEMNNCNNGGGNVCNTGGGMAASGNGININNTNNNTNNNVNTSNVVVNANVNATGGSGTGNALCLVTKDVMYRRGWHSGMCDCLRDIFGSIFICLCLPVSCCRLANRLDECAFTPYCLPWGLAGLRTKLRTMGGIRGSVCNDCVITNFLCCCVVCQMTREMDAMKL